MIQESIKAFLLIFLAEMGDKTQIFAMAFASKYSFHKVLMGVFVGSLLNHGLAIILGTYLTHIVPLEAIRFISALAFIFFGIWSLKIDEDNAEANDGNRSYGPIITVAAAFFIGELGDKTQLTAITLATTASYPFFILLGTVMGMLATSGIGVWVGSKLGKRIPETTMKLISSSIFIIFGLLALKDSTPQYFLKPQIIAGFILTLAVTLLYLITKLIKIKNNETTPFKQVADRLYINTKRMQNTIEGICSCKNDYCSKSECTVYCLSHCLKAAERNEKYISDLKWRIPLCNKKRFDYNSLKESLIATIDTCVECQNHQDNCVGNQTRKILETLYFGKTIGYKGNRELYYSDIKKLDPKFFKCR
ncbi:TMEM165/GDT1 family protein [Alkaliphilus pronyensis]|uniref:GDT1 family protein n=1 Tax=Alkaliphilus pronyensis TaxID=1482732 RepID=A0A6I0F1M3_9FIRM|nr:TMEM165/GDT1 family protein [Alkaliphilus pronyensis]KAB3534862.1 TMEM165/GDT1 family protein [Alkaliphilus pronyensis]